MRAFLCVPRRDKCNGTEGNVTEGGRSTSAGLPVLVCAVCWCPSSEYRSPCHCHSPCLRVQRGILFGFRIPVLSLLTPAEKTHGAPIQVCTLRPRRSAPNGPKEGKTPFVRKKEKKKRLDQQTNKTTSPRTGKRRMTKKGGG